MAYNKESKKVLTEGDRIRIKWLEDMADNYDGLASRSPDRGFPQSAEFFANLGMKFRIDAERVRRGR